MLIQDWTAENYFDTYLVITEAATRVDHGDHFILVNCGCVQFLLRQKAGLVGGWWLRLGLYSLLLLHDLIAFDVLILNIDSSQEELVLLTIFSILIILLSFDSLIILSPSLKFGILRLPNGASSHSVRFVVSAAHLITSGTMDDRRWRHIWTLSFAVNDLELVHLDVVLGLGRSGCRILGGRGRGMLTCGAISLLLASTLESALIQSLSAVRLNSATGDSRAKATAGRLYGLACFACAGHLAFQSWNFKLI